MSDNIYITKIEPPKDVILVEHPENEDDICITEIEPPKDVILVEHPQIRDQICITKVEPPKDVVLVEHPENTDTNGFTISNTFNTSTHSRDVELVKENVSIICAYTRCVMKEPVKNKICGHTFDKNAIMNYLKSSRHPRCPLAGCTNVKRLEASDFEVDKTVQLYIDKTKGPRD